MKIELDFQKIIKTNMSDTITITRDTAEDIIFSAVEHSRSYELMSDKYLKEIGFNWDTEIEFKMILQKLADVQIKQLLLKI